MRQTRRKPCQAYSFQDFSFKQIFSRTNVIFISHGSSLPGNNPRSPEGETNLRDRAMSCGDTPPPPKKKKCFSTASKSLRSH